MNASLFDLSPALRLVVLGAVIALAPMFWVWRRHGAATPAARLRALTVLLLFLTFDLVLFGAFTRLTDSGLGCPDWPGCYGHVSPIGASQQIEVAQNALPSGPVTQSKAWIEMIHRYLATTLGALITVSMLASWVLHRRSPAPGRSPWWASAAFVWVCVQGAFGALTVTMKLYPAIVTLHLLGGYAGLMLLTAQTQAEAAARLVLPPGLQRAAWVVLGMLIMQSALGGWVSTNYAVLACSEFPACQGSWWPVMNFEQGFTVRRELGMTAGGELLPFTALTAIHVTHRLAAVAVLLAMLVFAWRLGRCDDAVRRRFAGIVAALAAWQLTSGLSNVVLGWPLVAALAHTGGAGAAVAVLTALLVRARSGGCLGQDSGNSGRRAQPAVT